MSTPFSDIIDASTIKFKDFRYDKLKIDKIEQWNIRMEGFLMAGLPLFRNCKKSLSDRDDILGQFNETLNYDEIDILSDCIVIKWMERDLKDTLKTNSLLQEKNSTKRVNEPAMISAQRLLISQSMEELNRKMSDYGLSDYIAGVSS